MNQFLNSKQCSTRALIGSSNTEYLTDYKQTILYALRSLVRYRVEHEKIKFISTSGHVIFCLLNKHTSNDVFDDFPKISDHFSKISEDFPKLFRRLDECLQTFFEHFPKIAEDCQRQPKISKEAPMMFRSYNTTSEYFLSDYVATAMAILRLVTTT